MRREQSKTIQNNSNKSKTIRNNLKQFTTIQSIQHNSKIWKAKKQERTVKVWPCSWWLRSMRQDQFKPIQNIENNPKQSKSIQNNLKQSKTPGSMKQEKTVGRRKYGQAAWGKINSNQFKTLKEISSLEPRIQSNTICSVSHDQAEDWMKYIFTKKISYFAWGEILSKKNNGDFHGENKGLM